MAILASRDTRVLCQGITGKAGSFYAKSCADYGTRMVGGVTPGKGGASVENLPVFDTVGEAVEKTGANATMIYVPAPHAPDAIREAAAAGIPLIACITEGIPPLDVARLLPEIRRAGARLVGPNAPGLITPGQCKMGIMPGYIHKPGPVGVVSRSGTLTYEAVFQLSGLGLGQSTCVGIGADPIVGTSFAEILALFQADPATKGIVLVGEIGGTAEEEAADFIRREVRKPVAAFIAGRSAPPGRRMGHAGAIVGGPGSGGDAAGSAEAKIEALKSAGVRVTDNPAKIGETLREAMGGR